jgi:hypothetical protein
MPAATGGCRARVNIDVTIRDDSMVAAIAVF